MFIRRFLRCSKDEEEKATEPHPESTLFAIKYDDSVARFGTELSVDLKTFQKRIIALSYIYFNRSWVAAWDKKSFKLYK